MPRSSRSRIHWSRPSSPSRIDASRAMRLRSRAASALASASGSGAGLASAGADVCRPGSSGAGAALPGRRRDIQTETQSGSGVAAKPPGFPAILNIRPMACLHGNLRLGHVHFEPPSLASMQTRYGEDPDPMHSPHAYCPSSDQADTTQWGPDASLRPTSSEDFSGARPGMREASKATGMCSREPRCLFP
jgi:hypothetical protein